MSVKWPNFPGAFWYDCSDKDTWFRDEACTLRASNPEDVRFIADKLGSGNTIAVRRLWRDENGRYYASGDDFALQEQEK